MRHALLAAALLLAAAALPAAHAEPLPSVAALKAAALPKALAYLAGLASEPGRELNVPYLIEAIQGAGLDPGLWPSADASLLDRLVVPRPDDPYNDPIREIEAYAQTGYDPRSFGGRDLVADLKAAWPLSLQGVGQASFTILGLHAAGLPDGDPVIADAVRSLQAGQAAGGAWLCSMPDGIGLVEDVDCTGFALTALAAVHALLPSTAALAKAWLDQVRGPDGGYEEHPNPADPGESNVDSTVWAINGYRAIGAAEPESCWRFLLGLQLGDGSFAWKASNPAERFRELATEEIVASLATGFHAWPVYTDAAVAVPAAHAGVPAQLAVAGPFTTATWSVLGTGDTASGTKAELAFAQPGPAALHLDARGDGVHHRERIRVTVANDPPAFVGLPAHATASRAEPFRLQPAVADPEGQPVTLAWMLDGAAREGPVEAAFTTLGTHTLRLTATDPHGAAASATVTVAVANLPPQATQLSLPAAAFPGVPFPYAVHASDPDGPAPAVRWRFGALEAAGAGGQVALPAGQHEVRVDVTDSDGAVATLSCVVVVQPASAPAQEALPVPASAPPAPVAPSPPATAASSPPIAPADKEPVDEEAPATLASVPAAGVERQESTPGGSPPVPRRERAALAVPAVGVAAELLVAVALLALVRRRAA